MEVDRRDREDEVLHRLGVEGGVAGRKDPALADAKQADLVEAMALTNELDAFVQVAVNVVVEHQPTVGAGRVAPVYHVKIKPEVEQVANERAVLLQVRHRVAADKPIGDQDGRLDLLLGHGPVAVEGHLVLPPDFVLGRRGDLDVLVEDLLEQLSAARDLLPERGCFGDCLLRLDPDRTGCLAHDDAPVLADRVVFDRDGAGTVRRGTFRAATSAPSMVCTIASMPVAAVTGGGRPSVSSGSRMAQSGRRRGETTPFFS